MSAEQSAYDHNIRKYRRYAEQTEDLASYYREQEAYWTQLRDNWIGSLGVENVVPLVVDRPDGVA